MRSEEDIKDLLRRHDVDSDLLDADAIRYIIHHYDEVERRLIVTDPPWIKH